MSSKKKKILSALLASSMLVSQVSVVAFAEATNPTAEMIVSDLSSALGDVTYDGTAKKLTTVSVKTEEAYSDKISVSLSDVKYSTTEQDTGEYPETTVDEPIDAGTYYVYVKVTSNDTDAYNDYVVKLGSFTIKQKVLTASDLEFVGVTEESKVTKVYDGTTACNTVSVQVKPSVIGGESPVAIPGTAVYNSANVNEANKITFTPDAITKGNYTITAEQILEKTTGVSISQAEISEIAINDITAPSGGTALVTSATSENTALSLSSITWAPTASDGNAAYNQAYTASITVSLNDSANYKFADSVSATIGGTAATSCTKEGDNYKVTKDFAATAKKQISSVSVNGLTAPKAGGTPTVFKDLSSGSVEDYTVKHIIWYFVDGKNETLFTGETFGTNTQYKAVIILAPTNNCKFAESVNVTGIDGVSPVAPDAENGEITIRKTFDATGKLTNSYTTEPKKVENLKYTGEAQALVTAGEAKYGKVLYSTDNINWSEDIPKVTNAGTHSVYYKVEAGDDYDGIAAGSVSVSIAKADPTDKTAKTQNIIAGSGEFEAPSFTGVDGNALAGTVTYTYNGETKTKVDINTAIQALTKGDSGSISYAFTPNDNTNYNTVNGTINFTVADVTFKVGEAAATLENAVTIDTEKLVYGNSWDDIVTINSSLVASDGSQTVEGTFSLDVTGNPDAGEQTFKVQFTKSGKEEKIDVVSGKVNIAQKLLTVSAGNFAVTKSYDKTNGAGQKVDDTALTVDGIVGSDNVTVTTAIGNYGENINVGNYKVSVTLDLDGTAKDNYTLGEVTSIDVPATITAADIDSTINIAEIADQTYTGEAIYPKLTVKTAEDGDILTENKDYRISVVSKSNINVSESVTVYINPVTGGNYTFETKEKTFKIVPAELTVTADTFKVVKEYDGTKDAGKQAEGTALKITGLVNDEASPVIVTIPDFTSENVAKGKITVSLSLPDDCTNYTLKNNSVEVDYEITPKDIDKSIKITPIPDQTYTGAAIEPDVELYDGTTKLIKDTDYEIVSYDNNTNAGTATVTIKSKGNYTFTLGAMSFKIKPMKITPEITIAEGSKYDGTAKTPTVTVMYGEDKTVDAANYVVTYSDNINAGTGKVTITAKSDGNYTFADTSADFTIAKADAPTVADTVVYYGITETGTKTVPLVLPNVGTIDYTSNDTKVEISSGDNDNNVITGDVSISADGITFTLGENGENSGNTATITATIVSQNYENITAKLVVTINENKNQEAPACNLTITPSTTEGKFIATIEAVEGAEYKFNDGKWSSAENANVLDNIAPNTVVTAYIRLAEKEGYNASPVATATKTTPSLKVAVPTITPSGEFDGSQEVTITAAEGAEIYYTTDGSVPTVNNGIKYTAPFTVTSTTTVNAIAIKNGYVNSDVVSATYTKKAQVTEYTVTFSDATVKNGNVVVKSGDKVAEGTKLSVTATPKSGYTAKLYINGVAQPKTTATITATANVDIKVTYTKNSSGGGSSSGGSSGGSSSGGGSSSTTTKYPTINGKNQTWTDVAKSIEKLSEDKNATIELNSNTDVPADVIKAIANSNAEVTLKVDGAFSWTIDGSELDAKDAKSADFSITKTTVTGTNALRGIVGTGFIVKSGVKSELNIKFKKTHVNEFANLYKKVNGKLVFVDNIKIDENGNANGLEVSDNGEYVVMLGEYSDRKGDLDNDGTTDLDDALAAILDFLDEKKGENPLVCDFNNDGVIDLDDALEIINIFLKD